ncbi:DUF4185 domain-containing protein [Jiangella asiatica]|uniref:DUF4185 domain-containing protein n=1 Tax=Jiangella asiatica TaxID=2530372 RepID=A0A4R5D8L1_9ACTN|nr:DUF4185 domain-containing protein [Jiangella asiatica]TDE09902.1 DUF4185 domain-containing protein [Jiangella asiatica]
MMTPQHPGKHWHEADRLFREDEFWVGGDSAYSVPVGEDRAVWIFADTFISARGGERRSADSTMINNSVGIQDGLDPATGTMRFFWRRRADGRPASFLGTDDHTFLWPCNAVLLDGRLLLFAMRVRSRKMTPEEYERAGNLASFELVGWVARLVENPLDDPDRWRVRDLDTGTCRFATTLGAGALLVDGDHLYAHASAGSDTRGQYLARWRIADAADGHLTDREWWFGPDAGWLSEHAPLPTVPAPTVDAPQTEFTVHRDAAGRLVWVQTDGLFRADIVVREGERPEGPWTPFAPVYHPPEGDVEGGFVYGAKAHPEQRGAGGDLVLTYNNNALRSEMLMGRPELYYPTFVRVPR